MTREGSNVCAFIAAADGGDGGRVGERKTR
jgi:hypothetical protein